MGLLSCFCIEQIQRFGFSIASANFPEYNEPLCGQWLATYGASNGMMLGIVIFVALAKIGISYSLIAISKFERSHSVNAELASGTFKIFVAQFINSVLIFFFYWFRV